MGSIQVCNLHPWTGRLKRAMWAANEHVTVPVVHSALHLSYLMCSRVLCTCLMI